MPYSLCIFTRFSQQPYFSSYFLLNKRQSNQDYGIIMQDAAIGIVQDSENNILWVKRRDVPIWVLPGGGIDPGETPEAAVCREVLEETGLIVSVLRKAAVYSPINTWTAPTHIFICKKESGTLIISNESEEVAYFPFDAPPSPSFPLHDIWLEEALNNPDLVIMRPIHEFSWWKVGRFFLKHPRIVLNYLFNVYDRGRGHEDGHDRGRDHEDAP